MSTDQSRELTMVVTNTLIVRDIRRSVAFYRDVLGATVLREGEPTFLRLGNIWLTINRGGGPTDDKPEVVASPPRDPNVLSVFLNLRVTDIRRYYDLWSSRGAKFITEPKVHATELRCYMRDPDGYLIEVGQTTMTAGHPQLSTVLQSELDRCPNHQIVDHSQRLWGQTDEATLKGVMLRHRRAVEVGELTKRQSICDAFTQLAIVPVLEPHQNQRAQNLRRR